MATVSRLSGGWRAALDGQRIEAVAQVQVDDNLIQALGFRYEPVTEGGCSGSEEARQQGKTPLGDAAGKDSIQYSKAGEDTGSVRMIWQGGQRAQDICPSAGRCRPEQGAWAVGILLSFAYRTSSIDYVFAAGVGRCSVFRFGSDITRFAEGWDLCE